MKRFDVCPVGKTARSRLVVVLQHESLDDLTTTIVAPLFKQGEYRVVAGLTPVVSLGRQRLIVAVDRLASMPKRHLGKPVGNVSTAHFDLVRAVDFLISGI
jgi:mRNA-degrading endonuclease toxin of MazEF toxin-antitoxin module